MGSFSSDAPSFLPDLEQNTESLDKSVPICKMGILIFSYPSIFLSEVSGAVYLYSMQQNSSRISAWASRFVWLHILQQRWKLYIISNTFFICISQILRFTSLPLSGLKLICPSRFHPGFLDHVLWISHKRRLSFWEVLWKTILPSPSSWITFPLQYGLPAVKLFY